MRSLPCTLGLFTLLLGGCSSSRVITLGEWRDEARDYAQQQCAGDAGGLRLEPDDQGRSTFCIIGAHAAEKSTDVSGVLLGRRRVAGQDWLVFLVGSTARNVVTDIHIAALLDSGTVSTWKEGSSDAASLKAYRDRGVPAFRTADASGKFTPPPERFPREQDAFTLETTDDSIAVTDRTSGARWTLSLAGSSGRSAR